MRGRTFTNDCSLLTDSDRCECRATQLYSLSAAVFLSDSDQHQQQQQLTALVSRSSTGIYLATPYAGSNPHPLKNLTPLIKHCELHLRGGVPGDIVGTRKLPSRV